MHYAKLCIDLINKDVISNENKISKICECIHDSSVKSFVNGYRLNEWGDCNHPVYQDKYKKRYSNLFENNL